MQRRRPVILCSQLHTFPTPSNSNAGRCLTEEALRISLPEKGDRDFEFDRLFAPTDDQEVVFEEVSALVTR